MTGARAAAGGAEADGLLQRLTPVFVQLQLWLEDRPRLDALVEQAYRQFVVGLPRDGLGSVTLAPEAVHRWRTFETATQRAVRDELLPEDWRGLLAKRMGLTARLAGVLAALHGRRIIDEATLDQAIRLVQLLQAHARRAWQLDAEGTSAAKQLGETLVERRAATFSFREVYTHRWAGIRTAEQARSALDELERHHWVRYRQHDRSYQVNPRLFDRPSDDSDGRPAKAPPWQPMPDDYGDDLEPNLDHVLQKPGPGGTKGDDGNSETQPAEVQSSETQPTNGQPAETQPAEMQSSETQPSDGRPTETQPADGLPASDRAFELITDRARLAEVVACLEATPGPVALDCETTGLDADTAAVRLVSIGLSSGEVFVIDRFALADADLDRLWQTLGQRELIGHNLAFDLRMLGNLGFDGGEVFDTMIASQLVHAGERTEAGGRLSHRLAEVLRRELGVHLDKSAQLSDWSGELTADQLRYAAADVQYLHALAERLKARVKELALEPIAKLEHAALPAIAATAPVRVDTDRWRELAAKAEGEVDGLETRMNQLVGRTINWNSPPQVKAAFAELGVELASTNDDTLAACPHPLAALLRQHRSARKQVGTYGSEWLTKHTSDGFVRPTWQQCGAESGRMSCRSPNLQQIPRLSDYRRCFVPRPGCVFIKADYSQIELRAAAVVAQEVRMLQAYRDGQDLHKLTAAAVTGKPLGQVTKADRQLAKALNFGLLYGMGYRSLRTYAQTQYGVPMTEAEARQHYAKFFETYPGLRRWHDRLLAELHRLGPTGTYHGRTLLGRLRRIPAYQQGRAGNPFPNFTEAANFPVQGSSADGLKLALGLLRQRWHECPSAVLVLIVHDELVIEVPADQAEGAKRWLVQAMIDGMNQALGGAVPVEVEAAITPTWGG